ncbi:LysR family transcriptional regulator [Paracoccus laeviglucosivorans]|uniref:DNA-binding transcriptional regulator, LysR family n=1 Tax=Paracoccus laeviglucosivorans TaxID=1197861 RepID=A0A521D0U8_9RHOB|nr:LysR family transcriptional regulator [Paracoccus laeviglucosivorans]SMO64520.1 DNA-binding transcriptional regulator, LysR family [Paracoccus laeviglucosivorans]
MGEIEDLRVFLAVAHEASFVGASRSLGLPPPSVTRAVAGLEDRLGVQLFIRTTRKVSLTPAGAAFAARIEPLVTDLHRATDELRERQGDTAGLIRLNAPLLFGADPLPEIIAQFRILYPHVQFSVILSDAFVESVDDTFDMAIRISRASREVLSIWRKICRVDRVLAAAPSYLAAQGTPATPHDLEAHTCIAHDPLARSEVWELARGDQVERVRAGAALAANNAALMRGLARAGQGIVLLPRFMIQEDLASGRLVRILPDWEPPELWLTLYYPPLDRIPARLQLFSDFVERHVKGPGAFQTGGG